MATSLRSTPALTGWLDENLIDATPTTLEQLEEIVSAVGRAPWFWGHAVSFDLERRSHRVLYKTDALEIALFGWAAGQDTRLHDHGGASGAAFVCSGMLIEDVVEAAEGRVLRRRTKQRAAQTAFSFGPDYIHRVSQDPAHGVAISIHAYTPAISDALDYEVRPDGTLRVLNPVRVVQPYQSAAQGPTTEKEP
jgi:predicted metal-dependent enzyme (double-stranded beta helix superfamily)